MLADTTIETTLKALRNSGVDVDCGACMEVAWTGVTTNQHTCIHGGARGPWRCFFCDEIFTTPGAAADHFGGEKDHSEPGCLIDYRVQLEDGGAVERGRGLLMALRKTEAEARRLHRQIENLDNDCAVLSAEQYSDRRTIRQACRPGWTVERMIEWVHGHNPAHGGLVVSCTLWPCDAIKADVSHTFTPPELSEIAKGADGQRCIICDGWSVQEQHHAQTSRPTSPR